MKQACIWIFNASLYASTPAFRHVTAFLRFHEDFYQCLLKFMLAFSYTYTIQWSYHANHWCASKQWVKIFTNASQMTLESVILREVILCLSVVYFLFQDMSEILSLMQSSSYQDRKEGVVSLQKLLRNNRFLS